MANEPTWAWNPAYRRSLGLVPLFRPGSQLEVVEATCLFCSVFGREDHRPDEVKRRKKTEHAKVFTTFRPDNIRAHHSSQHRDKWSEYSALLRLESDTTSSAEQRKAVGDQLSEFFSHRQTSAYRDIASYYLANPHRIRKLLFTGLRKVEVVQDSDQLALLQGCLSAPLPSGSCLLLARYSAISAGTEMLVYRDLLPKDKPLDPTLKHSSDALAYPTEYGYAMVASVRRTNPTIHPLANARVFSFSPHKSVVVAPSDGVIQIPPSVPDRDAVFLPNMETALSLCMDGAQLLLPGARALVIGAGIVGSLVAGIVRATYPFVNLTIAEPHPRRRQRLVDFLEVDDEQVVEPQAVPSDQDVVFEVSGHESGLSTALQAVGTEGRIVLGSWFGSPQVRVAGLGGDFHRSHATIVASQVSSIPAALAGRWTKARRFDVVWKLIAELRPSRLITHTTPLESAPAVYNTVDTEPDNVGQAVFDYAAIEGGDSET